MCSLRGPAACKTPVKFCKASFFFNDTATTEIYTLSLHDALPIFSECHAGRCCFSRCGPGVARLPGCGKNFPQPGSRRSEEHTSELQSRLHLVCRLLLEKKKQKDVRFRGVAAQLLAHGEPRAHRPL